MQTLENVQRKIDSARDLFSVVKTMKALAAVNIHSYEKAVQSANSYFQNIEAGLQIVLKENPEMLKITVPKKEEVSGIIVFGAQRGLAGNFNLPIINNISKWVKGKNIEPKTSLVTCAIGDRIAEQLKDIGIPPESNLSFPAFRYHLDATIQELLMMVEGWRFRKKVTLIQLFYQKPLRGTLTQPFTQQLYPLDLNWLKRLANNPWPSRSIPFYNIPAFQLFNRLISQYFYITIFRAFLESMASENASRLMAMQKAEQNIEERLEELSARFHQQRQNAITDELLDIIAGFEALTKLTN